LRSFAAIALLLASTASHASLINYFKYSDGTTNWQYIANFSSGVLIITLSIVILGLFLARRRLFKANRELRAIKANLEERVKERTRNLNESNQKLLESNQALEHEVSEHIITTERLKAQEAYIQDILTSMPLMLVGLDQDGVITHWNQRTAELSGIAADQALGKTLWEAYPTATISPDQIRESIRHKRTIHLKQTLNTMSHFDITIYPLQESPEGGVVILIDDVSKETRAENMLLHNDKMSFMGEVASSMAHDINVPLQGILLDVRSFQRALESAKNEDGDLQDAVKVSDRLNQVIEQMQEKGDQVNSIINNLLAFSRGRKQEKQWVNVVDVMENTLTLASDVISIADDLPFNRIKVERHFSEHLPMLPCYITELQQVILSVLRHCAYAVYESFRSGQEGYHPEIKLLLAEEYGQILMRIHHNGSTLTLDDQVQVFEPYFQGEHAEEDRDAGDRLSFAHYIITEQHSGQMAVTSDEKNGTTFHIQLPLQD
jgi:PAS domain S-box-containing protein